MRCRSRFRATLPRSQQRPTRRARVYSVEVRIDNPQNLLKSGMIASIAVGTPSSAGGVTVIPLSAVVRSPSNSGGFAVYVAEGNGDTAKIHTQDVTLGETYGNDIAVRGGVGVNDRVVTSGTNLVRERRPGARDPIMSIHHKSDAEIVATTHNTARFFTEHRQVALILLLATFFWGWYGYTNMPKRKDPDIPVRVAAAQCAWPGATALQVEQLVTRPIENAVAQNLTIRPSSPSNFGIRSLSFPGLSVVYIQLDDNVKDKQKEFADINLKLNQLNAQLPRGAGPIQFNSNFGDTAALMLTVASPMAAPVEIPRVPSAYARRLRRHARNWRATHRSRG